MMVLIFLVYELTNKWTEIFNEVLADLKISYMSKPYYSVGVRKKRETHITFNRLDHILGTSSNPSFIFCL